MEHMEHVEFIGIELAGPDDKYTLGIATIKRRGDLLRFNIQQGKEGKGIFFAPIGTKCNGVWYDGFVVDSNSELTLIKEMLRAKYKALSANPSQTVSIAQAIKSQPTSMDELANEGVPF